MKGVVCNHMLQWNPKLSEMNSPLGILACTEGDNLARRTYVSHKRGTRNNLEVQYGLGIDAAARISRA